MAQNAAAPLPHAQVVLAIPLRDETLLGAGRFDYGTIFRLEETLPAHVEAVGEVAHVHQSHVFEFFADYRIELFVNFAAIYDRRTAAFLRGNHAEEADSRRPRVHVRALVVVEDRLVLRVWSRGIDFAGHAFAGQIAVFGVNFFVNGSCHALEIWRRRQAEAAEQNRAMGVQLGVDVVTVVAGPVGQINLVARRLHHQGK